MLANNDGWASFRRKEVFEFLDIELDMVWEQLLWMDPFNYGGVKLSLKSPDDEVCHAIRPAVRHGEFNSAPFVQDTQETQTEDGDGQGTPASVEMHWNICEYLPAPLHRVSLSTNEGLGGLAF